MTKNRSSPKRITPRQQLGECISREQWLRIEPTLSGLSQQEQEDVCLALVARLRFGIDRPFADPELRRRYELCVAILS